MMRFRISYNFGGYKVSDFMIPNSHTTQLVSSVVWSSPQDGTVITGQMSDKRVWELCNCFGADRLSEALENFIGLVDRAIAGTLVP